MTQTTNTNPPQSPSAPRLPYYAHAGECLRRLREPILEDWTQRVRAQVKGAAHLEQPTLRSSADGTLDRLAEALSPFSGERPEAWSVEAAKSHADERARLIVYDLNHMVHEYQILRDVVTERLAAAMAISPHEHAIIKRYFDATLRQAVETFTETQNELSNHVTVTMAQGLRGTLGVVRMATELAIDEAGDHRATRKLLARMRTSVLRADRIIQDVLDLFVIRAGRRLRLEVTRWNMLNLVTEVVGEHAEESGNRFDVDGQPVTGWWAYSALKRALENLFTNATRTGQAGATTTVRVWRTDRCVCISVQNGRSSLAHGEEWGRVDRARPADPRTRGPRARA